jgi:Malectin domain/Exo-beta-D-glucosaminidase Ig-fold domain
VLPAFYSDNYVSLLPGESKTITIDAAKADLAGEAPLITIDGWNIRVGKVAGGIAIQENKAMRPGPIIAPPPVVPNPPGVVYDIACGQDDLNGTPWVSDELFVRGGSANEQRGEIDLSPAGDKAAPKALYNSERYGPMTYILPMPASPPGHRYTVRLHFLELSQLTPGARRFNVIINGKEVLHEFDIFTESGGAGKLLIKDFPAEPDARGNIVIRFTRGSANEPEVRAVQVVSG